MKTACLALTMLLAPLSHSQELPPGFNIVTLNGQQGISGNFVGVNADGSAATTIINGILVPSNLATTTTTTTPGVTTTTTPGVTTTTTPTVTAFGTPTATTAPANFQGTQIQAVLGTLGIQNAPPANIPGTGGLGGTLFGGSFDTFLNPNTAFQTTVGRDNLAALLAGTQG